MRGRSRRRIAWMAAPVLAGLLALGTVFLTRATPAEATAPDPLRVVMYHGLTPRRADAHQYAVETALFESDLRYLAENGYSVVSLRQVTEHVQSGAPLPERPVLLTFDDGLYSVYRYAYPLLEAYDARILFAPIGAVTRQYSESGDRNPAYAYCGWEELREMRQSGRVEIASHSYDLHHIENGTQGLSPRRGESAAAWRLRITTDLGRMQRETQQELGEVPTAFVYPFGAIPAGGDALLRELGFTASFSCESRNNPLRVGDPDCLFRLGRWLRPPHTASAEFFASI